MVYVSLYFLLLAFFIYLHSISEPAEEKVQKVIGSIDFAFKGIKTKDGASARNDTFGPELGLAKFNAELRDVFEAAIPLVEIHESVAGDQIRLTIPVSQLFTSDSPVIRSSRDDLLAAASLLLIKRSGMVPTDMEILYDAGDNVPDGSDLQASLPARRLVSMVDRFLQNGVPARHVYMGMSSEGTGNIYLRFYVRDAHDSQFRRTGTP
jgi:flagellar motor protein MotB